MYFYGVRINELVRAEKSRLSVRKYHVYVLSVHSTFFEKFSHHRLYIFCNILSSFFPFFFLPNITRIHACFLCDTRPDHPIAPNTYIYIYQHMSLSWSFVCVCVTYNCTLPLFVAGFSLKMCVYVCVSCV